jgi:hypothetical protein
MVNRIDLRVEFLQSEAKDPSHCHPEEAKPVLSETKEGPLYLVENSNIGVLRFAQDDSIGAFIRSLFSPALPPTPQCVQAW